MLTLNELTEKVAEQEARFAKDYPTAGKNWKPDKALYISPEIAKFVIEHNLQTSGDNFYDELIVYGYPTYMDYTLKPDEVCVSFVENYGPLLHLSRVCHILRTWANTYSKPLETDDKYKIEEREKFREAYQIVDLAISKSNLLARLFFDQEGIRQVPCPVHKGRWSGCVWKEPECVTDENPQGCMSGSNVTGWLPNK
jgi:hypothetical protein